MHAGSCHLRFHVVELIIAESAVITRFYKNGIQFHFCKKLHIWNPDRLALFKKNFLGCQATTNTL